MRRPATVAMMCVLGALAAAARAQAPDGEAAVRCGVDAYERGALERAEECLRRALASTLPQRPRARAWMWLALTQAARQQLAAARESFKSALIDDPEIEPDRARVAPEVLAELDAVRPLILGSLHVEAPEADARVFVDGSQRALAPATVVLPVGRRRVDVVSADGFRRWSGARVLVRHGSTVRLRADFRDQVGTVTLSTEPADAEVHIVGAPSRLTKGASRLPAGRYRVLVRREGYADAEREVVVNVGATTAIAVRLPLAAAPELARKVGFALLGTSGALAIAGVVVGALARSSATEIHERQDTGLLDTPTYNALRSSADNRALGSNVLLGTAGAAAVAGVLLVVFGAKEQRAATPSAVRVVPRANGLALAVDF